MATTDALAAACNAINYILRSTFAEERIALGFKDVNVNFDIVNADQFPNQATTPRVTIFMYRVLPNLSLRTPPGRVNRDGSRFRNRLPVDMDLLVTIWGNDVSTQQRLTGWTMRTLADYPMLPTNLLNLSNPKTFERDEAVELVLTELSLEDTLNLWEKLSDEQRPYQLSLPYVVRSIWLDSHRQQPSGQPVQERQYDMGTLEGDEP